MFKRSLLATLLATAVFGPAAQAEDDLFFGALPVVGSVSRLQQPLSEAPGAVTVIDRDMIRASGVRNVADLLRFVPGFSVAPASQEPAIVGYHGLSNEEYTPRVQVLLDGRSLYSPLFKSGVNWNLIPVNLDDIERIEVMRGPNAVAYGSNAFLGVINIITQHPSLTRGWSASVSHGTNSVRDQSLRWGGQIGSADVRVSVRQQNDGGLQRMFDGTLGWFDPHDSRHAKLVDLRADVPLGDRDELRVSASQAYDISQYGRPGSLSDPMRDLSQSSTAFSAEWRHTVSASEDMRLRLSHVRDWSSDRHRSWVAYDTPSGARNQYFSIVDNGGESTNTDIDFQHVFAPWERTRLAWGGTMQSAAVKSRKQFFSDQWQHRSVHRAFGNLEWRPADAWLLNLGASLEHDSLTGAALDPRIGVSYHVAPGQTVRVVASRARRTPSLFEKRGDTRLVPEGGATPVDRTYLAKPGLDAERIETLEAGYLGEFKSLRASLDVRAFHERIPNRILIVPYALPPNVADDRDKWEDRLTTAFLNYPFGRADAAMNLERVSIRGYEYQWRWQPFQPTRIVYSHAYISVYALIQDPSDISEHRGGNYTRLSAQTRESAPRHSSSLMLIQQLPYDFQATVMYYKSDYMRWRRNSHVNPIERWDWRLAHRFRLGDTRGEIAFVSQVASQPHDGSRETRRLKEMHWLTLQVDF